MFGYKKELTLAITALLASGGAMANPTGAQIAHGNVSIDAAGSVLNVTNSPNAIINWQGFSIGAGEVTRFLQENAGSAVLNRVTGGSVSEILGQLQSNGRVFLINPNGLVIGDGATIDTAGFVGSTLNITDDDFLAGRYHFKGDGGGIVNRGYIKAADNGEVVLIAPDIENDGVIEANNGEIILAAGREVTLTSLDHEHISFRVQAPGDRALNLGKLIATNGAVGLFAGTVQQRGDISADRVSRGADGSIILQARSSVDVSGSVSARGKGGQGGDIQIFGDVVNVRGARIDASGDAGGGQIRMGGDYQGQGGAPTANRTSIDGASRIHADATRKGDGGRIIAWSDTTTTVDGDISARGGPGGGNGGFVETSGKGKLDFSRPVDVSAPAGKPGTWLLDPEDINIDGGRAASINASLNNGSNVAIKTSDGGSGQGNIAVNAPISKTAGGDAALSLQAHNRIDVNAPITSTAGKLNVSLSAGAAVGIHAPVNTNGGNFSTRITGVKPTKPKPVDDKTDDGKKDQPKAENSQNSDNKPADNQPADSQRAGGSTTPGQTEPNPAESNQAESNQTGSNQAGPNPAANAPAAPNQPPAQTLEKPLETVASAPPAPPAPEPAPSPATPPAPAAPTASPEPTVTPLATQTASGAPAALPANSTPTPPARTTAASGSAATTHAASTSTPAPSAPSRQEVVIDASVATHGGDIRIDAGERGDLYVNADVDASTETSGKKGGDIDLLGNRVGVFGQASVDASGAAGGGQIRIGGDQQGQNPDVRNASAVYIGKNAVIRSDAAVHGDGGKVVVFAEDTANILGRISATGGGQGGNGGFVETSGKRSLIVENAPDTSAISGRAGTWLIDPYNISIEATPAVSNIIDTSGLPVNGCAGTPDACWQPVNSSAILSIDAIKAGLFNGGNVVITTSASGGTGSAQAGNIDWLADLDLDGLDTDGSNNNAVAPPGSLTLRAHNDINITGSIYDSNHFNFGGDESLENLTLIADQDNDGSGDVTIDATGHPSPPGGFGLEIEVKKDITINANNLNLAGGADASSERVDVVADGKLLVDVKNDMTLTGNGFSSQASLTSNGDGSIIRIGRDLVLNNHGSLTFSGGGTKTGQLNIERKLLVNGGDLSGRGQVHTGELDWRSGSIGKIGMNLSTSKATLSTTGVKRLSGTWINLQNGVVDWNDGFISFSGATIVNRGMFNALGDNAMGSGFDVTTGTFENKSTGEFVKRNGAGNTTFDTVAFANEGMVDVRSGNVVFLTQESIPTSGPPSLTGGFTQTAGETHLGGGSLVAGKYTTSGGNPPGPTPGPGSMTERYTLVFSGGSLTGSGDIDAHVKADGATIAPGNSPGIINIAGNLNLGANSTLNMEAAGTGAGQFDQINVAGAAALAGAVNLAFINGYTPINGDSYKLVNSSGNTGTFGTFSPGALPNGVTASENYNATEYKVSIAGAPTPPPPPVIPPPTIPPNTPTPGVAPLPASPNTPVSSTTPVVAPEPQPVIAPKAPDLTSEIVTLRKQLPKHLRKSIRPGKVRECTALDGDISGILAESGDGSI